MSRDWQINGETMVYVKGRSDSNIATLSELGLSGGPVRCSPTFVHQDLTVNAWGDVIPAEVQVMLADLHVSMTLLHVDRDVLDECVKLSMGGAANIGALRRAGARMGNNKVRFAPGGKLGNHFIGLNLSSPVGAKPWRFYYSYLTERPVEITLGTEKSMFALTWRVIPYNVDIYNAGSGADDQLLWDHTLDN